MNLNFDVLGAWAKKNHINQLQSLSDEQLLTLKSLDISAKKLTLLPDSISQLVQLEELCMQNNNIKVLPKGLGLLANLETLRMFRNPITKKSEGNFYAELTQATSQHDFGFVDELGLIRATFARYFSYWNTLLPRTAIADLKPGG
jgi:Leucine-rich repeat (LRR) protein